MKNEAGSVVSAAPTSVGGGGAESKRLVVGERETGQRRQRNQGDVVGEQHRLAAGEQSDVFLAFSIGGGAWFPSWSQVQRIARLGKGGIIEDEGANTPRQESIADQIAHDTD